LATKNQSTQVQLSLAATIRLLREKKEWSQEDLAHKSGIHVTYLSGLECGRRNPTVKVLEQLAKALDVPISMLFKI
jgi:transcriptional regulator with XRE-family HTH domain